MMGCPNTVDMPLATKRERVSALPPAPYGQIQVMGLVGKASAACAAGAATQAGMLCNNKRRFISHAPFYGLRQGVHELVDL